MKTGKIYVLEMEKNLKVVRKKKDFYLKLFLACLLLCNNNNKRRVTSSYKHIFLNLILFRSKDDTKLLEITYKPSGPQENFLVSSCPEQQLQSQICRCSPALHDKQSDWQEKTLPNAKEHREGFSRMGMKGFSHISAETSVSVCTSHIIDT